MHKRGLIKKAGAGLSLEEQNTYRLGLDQFYNSRLYNPQVDAFSWQSALSNGINQIANVLPEQIGDISGRVVDTSGKVVSAIQNIRNINADIANVKDALPSDIAEKVVSQEGLNTAKAGNIMAIVGASSDLIGSFMPEKTEYAGTKGGITQTIDSVYDGISDAAMQFGPVGMIVGGAMKGANLLGKGVNALGGGTDGMTTTDAILGSSFLNLTPIGLINGLGGQRADTITKNNLAFEQVGSSYTGTNKAVDDALIKSGKKYGLFSRNSMNKANDEISEAKRQQNLIEDIAGTAADRFQIRNSMAAINGNRRRLQMQGGYDQSAVRVGRCGMILQDLQRAKRIVSSMKYQGGGQMKDLFATFVSTLPDNQKPTKDGGFNVKRYWELNGKPKNFDEAIERGMYSQEEDGWHAHTVQYNPEADEYEFMKSSTHPTLQYELDWYNSNDPEATEFRSQYELQKTEPYYKYVRRKGTEQPQTFKQGGSLSNWLIEIDINNVPAEFRDSSLQEVSVDSILSEFREGGKFNIIPEGALHARKHNMEIEGITPKGIPVVSQSEGGEIEQQAEIERNEVILRLEVTKKLEELRKKYDSSEYTQAEKDEFAIEAGKLLTYELLQNTIDNTGLINEV